jgi:hypothetical protein
MSLAGVIGDGAGPLLGTLPNSVFKPSAIVGRVRMAH